MRPAVSLLNSWGLLEHIDQAGTPPVRQTHFHYGHEQIAVDIKPEGNLKGLYAPRRWLLDGVLSDAAVSAGAELHLGTKAIATIKKNCGRVAGVVIRQRDGTSVIVGTDILVGADGRCSSVAEMVGSRYMARSIDRYSTVYTYVKDIPNQGYRWYFDRGAFAGLIPTTGGEHCLFASSAPNSFLRWFGKDPYQGAMNMLSIWEPSLAAKLAQQGVADRVRRFAGAPGHIRECAGPGWALVGDAGYFKDPATAHGITDAFLDADRLAAALIKATGDARAYQAERDQYAPELFAITQEIASRRWDLKRIKSLHKGFSEAMKREQASLENNNIAARAAA
jgi:2-polyprenyl-6-methoxyphenol hydroxylase-like FAD-dependent oxidoreductase